MGLYEGLVVRMSEGNLVDFFEILELRNVLIIDLIEFLEVILKGFSLHHY